MFGVLTSESKLLVEEVKKLLPSQAIITSAKSFQKTDEGMHIVDEFYAELTKDSDENPIAILSCPHVDKQDNIRELNLAKLNLCLMKV